MNSIYYKSANGVEIDFKSQRYKLISTDLFDTEWDYTKILGITSNNIKSFKKGIYNKKMTFTVVGEDVNKCYEYFDYFNQAVEYDILNSKEGKIYFGDFYLNCYIVSSAPSRWEVGINFLNVTVELLIANPTWTKDTFLELTSLSTIPDDTYHNYPFNYPFNYPIANMSAQYVTNDSGKESNFRLEIYGYAPTPSVLIAGNNYSFAMSLIQNAEYVVIDSLKKTIVKHLINGETVNIFNQRGAMDTTFKKIPIGSSLVESNCTIALTIYDERSEPKWTL